MNRHLVLPPVSPVPSRRWLVLRRAAGLAGLLWTMTASATLMPPGVAWQNAAADSDIDRAFAQARAEKKPVLLYWGATWCPPCNQLRATLFNRHDFIERAKAVVPVHVDGDGAGAQKLGGRFKVRGYPTMILMNPEGQEITRLPGEVDAPQVLAVLQSALAGGRPIKSVLADAQSGKAMTPAQWRLLAFYGWDIDEAQLVPAPDRPSLLAQLSVRSAGTEPAASTRLMLKALAESDDGKGIKPDDALRARVVRWLADARVVRTQMDVLVNQGDSIVRALAPEAGPVRQQLAAAMDEALKRLQADASLSRSDQVSALTARVEVSRLDQPKKEPRPTIPAPLLSQSKGMAERFDREITDGFERQAVITSAGHLLARAGLWTESDALLKANLSRSHSSYYLMSQLGSNARQRGRHDEALGWYEQAYQKSVGPATRLQWGSSYLAALVDLAPADEARIERAAAQLWGDAAQDPASFHERSARSLQRVGAKLASWNQDGSHDAVIRRLQSDLTPVCSRIDAADGQRASCEQLLQSAVKGGAAAKG